MMVAAWDERRERGSAAPIRLMIWLTLRLGRAVGQALLYPITLYFFLFSRGVQKASRNSLGRMLGRRATMLDVCRHLFTFSSVLLDRLFLLSNRLRHFQIEVTGLDYVTSAVAEGRGCVLLGAHLGSFEVLRAFARWSPVPVKVLMYRANSGAYSQLMERLDPALADAVIEIGTPEAMLRVRESLQRGEMVGILADRAPAGQKTVTVPFLGDPAPLPTGPVVLCAALGVPVVLFVGVAPDHGATASTSRNSRTASCWTVHAALRPSRAGSHVMRLGLRHIAALTRSTGSTSMISGRVSRMRLDLPRRCAGRNWSKRVRNIRERLVRP